MKIVKLEPLGVKLTDVDLRNESDRDSIGSLLYTHGFILLPSGCAAVGAPPVNDPDSLETLGSLFGTPEVKHCVKTPVVPGKPVHILETNGPQRVVPDSYIFHSDTSWRADPNIASVLTCVKPSKSGGNTMFFDVKDVVNRLSARSRALLENWDLEHSFHYGYKRVASDHLVDDKSEVISTHPGIVRHPRTGVPLVYANRNYCNGIAGMDANEAKTALQDLWSDMYKDWEKHTYTHSWSIGDTVIWDNIGTQHRANNDYKDLRVMHRVVCRDPDGRLERFSSDERIGAKGLPVDSETKPRGSSPTRVGGM